MSLTLGERSAFRTSVRELRKLTPHQRRMLVVQSMPGGVIIEDDTRIERLAFVRECTSVAYRVCRAAKRGVQLSPERERRARGIPIDEVDA